MALENPYMLQVPRNGTSPMAEMRRIVEPFCVEHMEGFADALESRVPKDPHKRVQAHQLMRLAFATAHQAKTVAYEVMFRQNPLLVNSASFEATLNASTLKASVTDFITQMIHTSLDIYPRLFAPRLCSVQPFTQPSGYVFFLKRVARNKTTGAERELADLTTFDKDYGNLTTEGQQLEAVGITLSKQLVEVTYHGLLHQHSHQSEVALRTQYGLAMEALGDLATADELAWEVDRQVIDALVTFAETNSRGTLYWDPTDGGSYASYAPSEKQAYDQTFVRATLTQASAEMSQDVFVQPNWALCGLNVVKLLARTPEALAEPISDRMFDQARFSGSLISSGRMRDGAELWHDPQLDPDTMIYGHTQSMNPFWAGYIFSPFGAASILTAAFMDPDNLMRRKARALAYAKVGVRSGQYRVIRLGTGS